MPFLIQRSHKTWYSEVQFEFELLRVYADGVEAQISNSIADFSKNMKTELVEEYPEEGHADFVNTHRGLVSYDYDLKHIFGEYFPSIQRAGAMLTLTSFFEFQLSELCKLYELTYKRSITQRDMKGSGVERSVLFLRKVAGLKISTGTSVWEEVSNIRKLRNYLTHNDGKVDSNLEEYISKSTFLDKDHANGVIIPKGFLKHVIESFDKYFESIDACIQSPPSSTD